MQNFEEQFQGKLLTVAYEHLKVSSIAISVHAIILASILYPYVAHTLLVIWLVLLLGVSLYRFKLAKDFARNPHQYSIKQWESNFIKPLFVSSFLWSVVPFLFFVADNYLIQAAMLVLYAGLSAGAISALSSMIKALNIFVLMLLVPIIIVLFMQQTQIHIALALLASLFLALVIVAGRRFHGNYRDILEAKQMYKEEKEKSSVWNERFEIIFKNAPVGIFFYDNNLVIKEVNQEFMNFLEAPKEFLIGLDLHTIPDKRILPTLRAPIDGLYGSYEGEYNSKYKQKELYISMQTSPLQDSQHRVVGAIGIVSDITEKMVIQKKIEHQAKFDILTNIPNRLTLKEQVEREILRFQRHKVLFAILFLDLDHFKNINDSLGHAIGDRLLIAMAEKLKNAIRDEDTVARIGGDEFVILMSDLSSNQKIAANTAEHLALRVSNMLHEPILIEGHQLRVSSSIGIALVGENDSAEDLFKHADIAMYQAKKDGRAITRFYQQEMDIWVKRRVELENGLRNALFANELEVYYQPIIALESSEIIGAEALLRWNSQEFGTISPVEFIPIAEDSGLIIQIGDFVLERALNEFARWKQNEGFGEKLHKIAINISVRQFKMKNFVAKLKEAIEKSGVDPHHVEIEIVESIIIDDVNEAKQKMQEIRNLGVGLSIDDFGTGYSSLLYLKQLSFTTLKIDRSFVGDIDKDEEDKELIETVINIAKKFNLKVVAEGVENEVQHNFLAAKACDYFQGFYCSPAVKSDAFLELLKSKNTL